jgi:putative NIF3 family GTP cyclohydrolase 1 type 2
MIYTGMIEKFGWAKYRQPGDESVFALPPTTVGQLAVDLRKKFGSNGIRVVGDLKMKATKVAFSAGAPSAMSQIRILQRDDVEVLVAGETREWETVEYARDASAEGRHKALIVLGHALTEEAGMDTVARWLKGFITTVPVEFIPAGQPFVALPQN